MATSTYNTPIDHTSDAGFRAWGLELSLALTAIGLTPTADTGQINWVTVTRPAAGAAGGYEIRYLNDSLNGTAPIVVKLEFGTGGTAAIPALWITVGSGSNGGGTITGVAVTRAQITINGTALASTVTNYPTSLCKVDGYFGLALKSGAQTTGGLALIIVQRTVDSAGASTAEGYGVLTSATASGSPSMRSIDNATGAPVVAPISFMFVPMGGTLSGSPPQFIGHSLLVGATYKKCQFSVSTSVAQQADGSTFTTQSVEAVDRTFLQPGVVGAMSSSPANRICMYWN